MVQVYCPNDECTVPVCHHKHAHEFNKVTCSLTHKLKKNMCCNHTYSTCMPVSQTRIPCDDCIRLDCELRNHIHYEYEYENCGYVTQETLKRTPVTITKPNCYGYLYDKNEIQCAEECEITMKCILKCIETVDKGIIL
jgi:hypothetical protein